MNKTGLFIQNLRKEKNLTQLELANKLYISDRTVSKWERGKGMPDSSIMLPLCSILGITVNELLMGEKMEHDNNDEMVMLLTKQKEEQDKLFLTLEIILGFFTMIIGFIFIFSSAFLIEDEILKLVGLVIALIIIFVGISLCLVIEQRCGYYECGHCHHKYVPSYKSVFFAMHTNRTRYMKCPKCNKKSWNKKVIK